MHTEPLTDTADGLNMRTKFHVGKDEGSRPGVDPKRNETSIP